MKSDRPEILALRGLPGSGKSTWAHERIGKGHGARRWIRVATNELRVLLLGRETHWSRYLEDVTLGIRDAAIAMGVRAGLNVIVDDCHLDPKSVENLRILAETEDATYSEKRFDITLEEALWRNHHRQYPVPEHSIITLHRSYGKTRDDVRFAYREHIEGLPSALIVDLDGTLAIPTDRQIHEYEKCASDRVNQPVYDALQGMIDGWQGPLRVLIVSGRPERSRVETRHWLADLFLGHEVFLRADGDDRSEAVVKRELFDTHIAGKYNVLCVFDDRDRSVAMWRSLGLPTFQCAEGNF